MKWTATTATAASGGCRKLLLGPRPAGCECNCTKQTLGAATRTHLRGESPPACGGYFTLSRNRTKPARPASSSLYTPASASTCANTWPTSSCRIRWTLSLFSSGWRARISCAHAACFCRASGYCSAGTRATSISARSNSSCFRRLGRTARPMTSIRPMFSFLMWWSFAWGW